MDPFYTAVVTPSSGPIEHVNMAPNNMRSTKAAACLDSNAARLQRLALKSAPILQHLPYSDDIRADCHDPWVQSGGY